MGLNSKNIKAPKGKSTPQKLIKRGAHPARLVQLIDLGVQKRKAWEGTTKSPINQFWVTYELGDSFLVGDDGKVDKTKPRWLSERMNVYNMSVDKATSTKRMAVLDPEGEMDGDWSQTLNTPIILTVTHSKCGKYSNVGAISEPMEGMSVPALINDTLMFDLDSPDIEVFDSLPDFLKEIIQANLDYSGSKLEALINGDSVEEDADEDNYGQDIEDDDLEDTPY